MSDANHRPGMICSHYYCNVGGVVDTEMGMMCADHARPLMFMVQMPRVDSCREPMLVPWEFVREHDRQARVNHGGQTLARLSERGGLDAAELLAVLQDRSWREMDHREAVDGIRSLLASWCSTHERSAEEGADHG